MRYWVLLIAPDRVGELARQHGDGVTVERYEPGGRWVEDPSIGAMVVASGDFTPLDLSQLERAMADVDDFEQRIEERFRGS